MNDAVSGVPVWELGPGPEFAPLDRDISCDVCVVGLGGSGLSAIAESLAAGANVVGIDAKRVAGGAAGRNGGFLLAGLAAFHHDAVSELGRERAAGLYRLTVAELDRLAERHPRWIRRTGSLRIADSEAELRDCEDQLAAMTADGLSVERYAGPEGDGLLFGLDCVFNPLERCRELAQEVVDGGARLFELTPATAFGAGAVETPRAQVRCASVIVAVDGGLERLLPETASHVRTARLQMLATAPTDELQLARPVYRRYGFEYYQQTPDGRIALGGFRDRAGESEWTFAAGPTPEVQALLEGYLRDRLGVRAKITHRWAASVGYSRSVLPLCREMRPGLWAVGGYSGTGNVIGALLGRAAAQMVTRGASVLHDAFYAR